MNSKNSFIAIALCSLLIFSQVKFPDSSSLNGDLSSINFTEEVRESDLRLGAGAVGLSSEGDWLQSARISNIVEGTGDVMVAVIECNPTCLILDTNESVENFGRWTGYNQSRIVGIDTRTMNIKWVVDLNASAIHDIIPLEYGFLVSASIQYWTPQLPLVNIIPDQPVQWWGVDSCLIYLNDSGGVERWVRLADNESTPLDILKMSADNEGFTVLGHLNWGLNWTPEMDMNKEMTISVLNNGSEKIDLIPLEITPNDLINNLTGFNSPLYAVRFNLDFTINWSQQILIAHDFDFTFGTGYANEASPHFAFISTHNDGTSLLLNFGYNGANYQSPNSQGYFEFSDGTRWNVSDYIPNRPHILMFLSLSNDGDLLDKTLIYSPTEIGFHEVDYNDYFDNDYVYEDRLSIFDIRYGEGGLITGFLETSQNLLMLDTISVNESVSDRIFPGIYRFQYSPTDGINMTLFLPVLTNLEPGFTLSSMVTDNRDSVLISGYVHTNLTYSTVDKLDGKPFNHASFDIIPFYGVVDKEGYIVAQAITLQNWGGGAPQFLSLFKGGQLIMGNDCFTTYWIVGQVIVGDQYNRCNAPYFNQSEWGLSWPMIGNWERDGDAISSGEDVCPDVTDPLQLDTDGDGIGDLCDWDADSDGIHNGNDSCPFSDFGTNSSQNLSDTDGDGCYDFEDGDIDGDGLDNERDSCPFSDIRANSTQNLIDTDSDGCYDFEDDDIDGDRVPNEVDECPDENPGWTSNSSSDSDGNGCPDPPEDTDESQSDTNTNSTEISTEDGNQTIINEPEAPRDDQNSTLKEDDYEPPTDSQNPLLEEADSEPSSTENKDESNLEGEDLSSPQYLVFVTFFLIILSLVVTLSLFDYNRGDSIGFTNSENEQ